MRRIKAFTLTELMVTITIVSVALLVMVKAFKSIQMAIQYSKDRMIAVNLAQEKLQIIRDMSYYKIIPSTSVSYLNEFTPSIPYDNFYFEPENVLEAGVRYTRYTYVVPVVEVSTTVVELPPQSSDTGMKKVTVTVVWRQGREYKNVQLSSIISNPDTVMANSVLTGTIQDSSTLLPVSNAFINIAEYIGYRTYSDSFGNFTLSITPGNYTLYITAKGYFSHFETFSISANQTLTKSIYLTKMDSGNFEGVPWIRDHLVISQVVGSTENATTGFDQEYIEIYNPTTYTWLVNGEIGLKFQRIYDTSKKDIKIDYRTDYIYPGGFYLFANTSPVVVAGLSVDADAVWDNSNSSSDFPYFNPSINSYNIIPVSGDGPDEGGGAIELYRKSDGKILDQVGWNRNNGASKYAPFCEGGACMDYAIQQNIGLEEGEQYIRYSSTDSVSSSYGPAYDSNVNRYDFKDNYSGITIPPRNSSTTITVISATPADGAIVSCSDGLSVSTSAYLVGSDRKYAYFNVVNVATGTWTCSVSSNTYGIIYDTVTVTSGSTFTVTDVYLDTYVTWGYVTGQVTDIYGMVISPSIKVENSLGDGTYVDSNGRYSLMVSTGSMDMIANPENLNPYYVSLSSQNINISPGEIHSGVDFVLYQGAKISGFVTRDGVNPIPGMNVIIYDTNLVGKDSQLTDSYGRFLSNILSTGTYIVQVVTDSKESVSPSSTTVTLISAGSVYFSSTFTVTNAIGYIQGSVSENGEPIKSGVLIVVTTDTLSGTPPQLPDLSSSTLAGAPYYIASSNEEGEYTVEARENSNYIVYAYYPYLNGSTFEIKWASASPVSVLPGQYTTGLDFSW